MQVIKTKKLTWIDIKNPSKKDLEWLRRNYNLHPLVLEQLLPDLDYPRVENFGDYIFLVLFYPFFERTTFQTIPFELDIIVSKKYIITAHPKDIVPLKAIFDKCNLYEEERDKYTKNGPGGLLYFIIEELLNAYFPKLKHIKQNIDKIERLIYEKEYQKAVREISLVRRDLIGFQRIVESQRLAFKTLAEDEQTFFEKKLRPYFNELWRLHNQIEHIVLTNQKTLDALSVTNESLLTNWTNKIIKTLTIFSVIVFPLTLLAAVFGMNTSYLPFVGRTDDFWIITGIMAAGTTLMLLIFKLKKWI